MFPKDAHFICRKCMAPILFREKNFKKIEQLGYIGCFKCRQRTPHSEYVSEFFEHYPWFVSFIPIMKLNGFEPESYTVKKRKSRAGHESYIISVFTFTCMECGGSHTIDLVNTECWTDDLYCRNCGAKPYDKEYAASFFHHFTGFHDAQINITELQADIFLPSQLDPDNFQIQRFDL